MRLSSEMLVEALRRYADDNDLTHVELGKRFGFNASKTGNVFSGRTRLSGDDVLRILEDPDFALPKLKKYIAYWRLRRDVTAVERDMRDSDTVSEDTLFSRQADTGVGADDDSAYAFQRTCPEHHERLPLVGVAHRLDLLRSHR